MLRPFNAFLAAISFLLFTSCDHSQSPTEVVIHDDALSDDAYATVLRKETREASVYSNFETKLMVKVTYLSDDFRMAFDKRYETLMEEKRFSLGEADKKSGFFISIFTPDQQKPELDNSKFWTLILKNRTDLKRYPTMVRHLSEKDRWKPFFPWLNRWSHEYLVLFDSEEDNPTGPEAFTLSLSNPDARVSLNW